MIIYCYILLAVNLIDFGKHISNKDLEAFSIWLVYFLLMLPLIGRIIGWW